MSAFSLLKKKDKTELLNINKYSSINIGYISLSKFKKNHQVLQEV